MPVNTKRVSGRRHLHFDSLDEVVADVDRLVAAPNTKTLGNWPLDRLINHLTVSINGSIDGLPWKAPWLIRRLSPLFKRRMLSHAMSPGFNLPKRVEAVSFPASASAQQALEGLKTAVSRTKSERMEAGHPVFPKLTHEEWTQLHLRHAELHLSYVVPR